MHDPIWVCRDGRMLHVRDMTTAHIVNAIRYIERSRSGWRREWLPRLYLELEIRAMGLRS